MKNAKAKNDDISRSVLRDIYHHPGGAGDLRRFEQKPRNRRRTILLLALSFFVLAAIVALIGMTIFMPKEKFSGNQIRLSFSGAPQAAAGDSYVLSITVANTSQVRLTKLELTLRSPDGFQFTESTPKPENEFSNAWSLGALNAGAKTTVRISGKLMGELGDTKAFSATANFVPANFASEFQSEATFSTRLSESALKLDITAPNAVTGGQDVTYVIKATNTSEKVLNHIRLLVEYPEGFSTTATDPKPTEGSGQWDHDILSPDKSFSVTIKGKLKGDGQSVTELKAQVGILDASSAFLSQREKSALVLILQPTLNLTITSDGATVGHAVSVQDPVPFQLSYSNDGDNDFTNSVITLTFRGKDSDGKSDVNIVDVGGIKSGTPFSKTTDGTSVQWTKDEIPDLARLIPGKKGTIDVTLPIKSGLRSVGSGVNLSLSVQASVKAEKVGETGSGFTTSSSTLTFPVNTELRLAVEARYFSEDGTAVGSGPIPPQVGTTTTYVISWFLTNTLNGANAVLLTATLPDAVTFTGADASSGNAITYDETSRHVRWRIEKVDARTGQTLPTLTGTFRVSVTPTEGDVGNILPLLGTTSLTATDAFTATSLTAKGNAITTDLTSDTNGQGKGAVVAGATDTNTVNVNSVAP
ncbi:MAG: hypothetical protein V1778_01890 [bacterium]